MTYSMSDLLQLMVSVGSSDLPIRVRFPPVIRVHGVLRRVEGPPLRPEDTDELMINTPSVAALIRDNKTFRIQSDIQTGAKYGMVTLDAYLMQLYRNGVISREEVVNKSQDPTIVPQKLAECDAAQSEFADQPPRRLAA